MRLTGTQRAKIVEILGSLRADDTTDTALWHLTYALLTLDGNSDEDRKAPAAVPGADLERMPLIGEHWQVAETLDPTFRGMVGTVVETFASSSVALQFPGEIREFCRHEIEPAEDRT